MVRPDVREQAVLLMDLNQRLNDDPELQTHLTNPFPDVYGIWRWRRYGSVEGTGKADIVLSVAGSWATRNLHNTAKFPRVQVEITVDAFRDENENSSPINAEGLTTFDRVLLLHEMVYDICQLQPGELRYGDSHIVAVERPMDPTAQEAPGIADGSYALSYLGFSLA